MKINLMLLFLLTGIGWCFAQDVPEEVMKLMKNYSSDSAAADGFLSAKKWLKDCGEINAADIEVGTPVQKHRIRYEILDTCSDSIPFNKLIEPKECWVFPVKAKKRYLYNVIITKYEGEWHISGREELSLHNNMWDQLCSAYPEYNTLKPVLVADGLSYYFYFKQKGPRTIYYIRPGYQDDPLEKVSPGSIASLDDSKNLVKYWKKEGKGSNNNLEKIIQHLRQEEKNGGGK